ncbi:hypothetical protein EAE96_008254 [Botrytis aclada]|nr:hypothetical protein EAE96_008254 [Botrytis aclada]
MSKINRLMSKVPSSNRLGHQSPHLYPYLTFELAGCSDSLLLLLRLVAWAMTLIPLGQILTKHARGGRWVEEADE